MESDLVNDASRMIQPFQVKHNDAYRPQLLQVIDLAIELDKELCREVCCMEWIFASDDGETTFDSSKMELELVDKISGSTPEDEQKVIMVTAPAIKKRSRSTAENFDH